MLDHGCKLTSEPLWPTAGSPPTRWSAPPWLQRPEEEAEKPRRRVRAAETDGWMCRRGSRNSWGGVWVRSKKKKKVGVCGVSIQMHHNHSPQRRVCVCARRACILWSPRTCRLSAAGCGSQLSGELRERVEPRWKEGQRQTRTGANARSLQMNGDKSARAIDPLVKAPLRLQPNVLKKETSAPVGALGGRQPSSDETHLPHNMQEINTKSWWTWLSNTFTSIEDRIICRLIYLHAVRHKGSGIIVQNSKVLCFTLCLGLFV